LKAQLSLREPLIPYKYVPPSILGALPQFTWPSAAERLSIRLDLCADRRFFLHRIGELAHEPYEIVDVPFLPIAEDRSSHSLTRPIHSIGHRLPFTVMIASRTRRSAALPLRFTRPRLSSLATDGGVVAPDAVCHLDYTDRPEPLDPDQQRELRPVERYTRFAHHGLVALRAVHHG
jgi:hypothetical protein